MPQQGVVELQQVMSCSASVPLDEASKLSKESGNYTFWKTSVMTIFQGFGCGVPEYLNNENQAVGIEQKAGESPLEFFSPGLILLI